VGGTTKAVLPSGPSLMVMMREEHNRPSRLRLKQGTITGCIPDYRSHFPLCRKKHRWPLHRSAHSRRWRRNYVHTIQKACATFQHAFLNKHVYRCFGRFRTSRFQNSALHVFEASAAGKKQDSVQICNVPCWQCKTKQRKKTHRCCRSERADQAD
jgi:hypothetical protein